MKKKRNRSASPELGIFKNFLVNRLTAAGVSHVVTSSRIWKRWAWFFALWAIFLGMSYMTFQVVQEYLKYPTAYKTERKSATVLEFPSVTVCGLNIIPRSNAIPADVQYLIDLQEKLFKLKMYNVSAEEKQNCTDHPLCYWSWTLNKCHCVASPCDTALCFPHEEDNDGPTCCCSMLICKLKEKEMDGACDVRETNDDHKHGAHGEKIPTCVCRKDFHYPGFTNVSVKNPLKPPYDDDFSTYDTDPHVSMLESRKQCSSEEEKATEKCRLREALMSNEFDERAANLINYIRESRNDDLQDIKKLFHPSLKATADYGNAFDNVILSCSFGKEECDRRNFSTLFSPSFGKCYMFNYIGSDHDRKPYGVKHAGRRYGLQLYLQTLQTDSIDMLNPQIGARVVVHDPHVLPFATEHGIDIRPGDMTSIDVEYVNVSRLGKPWGDCVQDGSSLDFEYKDKIYSRIGCERKCMNDEVMKRCNCYHTMFLSGTTTPNRPLNLCNTTHKKTDDDCFMDILRDRDAGNINCRCPPPCKETTYVTNLSAGKVNQEFFKIVRSVKSIQMENGTPYIPKIVDNFEIMGLRVYYKEMFFSTIIETQAYSWQSLVANIGGNMGLFLGLSLVTFLEIFEFITDLLCSMLMVKKKKKKQRKLTSKIHPKEAFVSTKKKFFTI